MKAPRICIDARLENGVPGGTQQVVIGMAHGLSQLTEGDEQYFFLVNHGHDAWLKPYVSGPCQLLMAATELAHRQPSNFKKKLYHWIPTVREIWQRLKGLPGLNSYRVPSSDGVIERSGI